MPRKDRGYQDLIRAIKEDNISGASLISRKAAKAISLFTQQTKAKTIQAYYSSLLKIGKELISAQPDMVSIFNLVNSILVAVEEKKDKLTLEQLNNIVRRKAGEFHKSSLKSLERMAEFGQTLIFNGCTILTYSFSGGVFSILKKAKEKGKRFEVVVSESRPMFEGRKLALSLGKLGIPVTLVTDAALGLCVKESDLVLVGADCISEKSFVNKVGTYGLSLLAKELGIPFYVASDWTKFISEKWRKSPKRLADPKEVLSRKLKNVKAENQYFEEIPLLCCKKIITSDGFILLTQIPVEIRKTKISRKLIRELKRLL
jgi:translation initiation factor eIF-2B subunit delta